MTDKHTQCAEILRYVQEHGSITTLEATHELLIINFTARISELRRRGVIVTTEDITKKKVDLMMSIVRSKDNGAIRLGDTAENLYKKGYRKASEVAEEIFAEIEKEIRSSVEVIVTIKDDETDGWYDGELNVLGFLGKYLDQLKKKYTESEDVE